MKDFTNTRKALISTRSLLVQAFKRVLRKHRKKASGKTLKSIKGRSYVEYGKVGIRIYGSPVFKFITGGRHAGAKAPPRQAILTWIRQKKLKPKTKNMKRASLAYLIARSIGKKGIQPVPIIEEALKGRRQQIKKKVLYGIKKDLSIKNVLGTKLSIK